MHPWSRRALGAAAAIAVAAIGPAAAAADQPEELAELGWPATTRSVGPRGRTATIYAEPGRRRPIGTLARGARVAWTAVHAGDRRCRAWLELTSRGYVCARELAPSELEPSAPELSLGPYADVRGAEAEVFATIADVRAGVATGVVPGTTFVAIRPRTVTVDGVRFLETDQGYLPASALSLRTPSGWAGFDPRVEPPPAWPFAWVMPAHKGDAVDVRAAPRRQAERVDALAARARVPVFETVGRWTRVGDERWIETARLRVARVTAAPVGVAADGQWIDVDLDQQVLIAYEGATPAYATLVSTGRKEWRTPYGVYRIRTKAARTRMRSPIGARAHWDVAEVPWSMGFRKNFALHGAYWHDGFGSPRSHGCVNLSPADAAHVFAWAGPSLPDGWRSLATDATDAADLATGTVVRLRDRRHPDPPWRGYLGERVAP
ncbi:MAG: L,D-transpeptidase [Myxococcales bacterium]|nr:L,D-transpeptidase [Myxococcales bacterium]